MSDIETWFCFYGELSVQQIASCNEILSGEERTQAARFAFEADRRRYVVARAMARTVLGGYLKFHPSLCAFERNEYGKPFLRPALQGSPPLSFNISHTEGLIVLTVTHQLELGVDVEDISAQHAPLEVARDYFVPLEIAQLQSLPSGEQGLRFFELWTLKEAYIKARGMGLSIPLDLFGFTIEKDMVHLTFSSSSEHDVSSWQFWQFRPTRDHLMALCVERGLTTPRLRMWKFAPGLPATSIAVPVVRTSP